MEIYLYNPEDITAAYKALLGNEGVDIQKHRQSKYRYSNNIAMGEKLYSIKTIDGKHFLLDNDGNKVPGVIMTCVTDEVNHRPSVLVKLYVNLI